MAHVSGFQEAIRHLANADFQIPSYIAATILLSTLPSDPNDPTSWNNHVSGIKIDKNVTTLSSVIARILEEKCHLTEDNQAASQKQETAFAALEHKAHTSRKKFCTNCMRDGHWSCDCYGPGGAKEHEHPCKGNWGKGKRKKGKEKANNIEDGGEGDSNNKTLNHVQFDEHIMTTDFSDYTMSTKCLAGSYFTPQLVEDLAYSSHKTLSSPTAIIDSSTSTHIHSNCNDFLSLDSSTSRNIKGFRGAKSHVTGCGTALIAV